MIPALCLPTDVGCMAREASGGAFEAVVDALEAAGRLIREPDFKTLRVYRKA